VRITPRIRITDIDHAVWELRRGVGLAVALQHPALRIARGRTRPLIGLIRGEVDPLVLHKAPERVQQAIVAIAFDRPGLPSAMGFQFAARNSKPLTPAAAPQHRASQHRRLEIQLHLGHRLILD
jgi:hypothetical protein